MPSLLAVVLLFGTVGQMHNAVPVWAGGTPPVTYDAITTQNGANITTQNGHPLKTDTP